MVPESVIVSAVLSLDPASVELTAKEPVTLRVPVAPAYFPVPPVIVAFPVMVTAVGAAASAAQPLEEASEVIFKVPPAPLNVPIPLIESHWLAGAELPVPVIESRPPVVPVPVAVTVAATSLLVQTIAILPL